MNGAGIEQRACEAVASGHLHNGAANVHVTSRVRQFVIANRVCVAVAQLAIGSVAPAADFARPVRNAVMEVPTRHVQACAGAP